MTTADRATSHTNGAPPPVRLASRFQDAWITAAVRIRPRANVVIGWVNRARLHRLELGICCRRNPYACTSLRILFNRLPTPTCAAPLRPHLPRSAGQPNGPQPTCQGMHCPWRCQARPPASMGISLSLSPIASTRSGDTFNSSQNRHRPVPLSIPAAVASISHGWVRVTERAGVNWRRYSGIRSGCRAGSFSVITLIGGVSSVAFHQVGKTITHRHRKAQQMPVQVPFFLGAAIPIQMNPASSILIKVKGGRVSCRVQPSSQALCLAQRKILFDQDDSRARITDDRPLRGHHRKIEA